MPLRPSKPEVTIPYLFREQAKRLKSRPMVYSRTRHHWRPVTWSQMQNRVDAAARGLVSAGIDPSERGAIMAENCIEWVIADQACATLGIATVAISTSYSEAEVAYILDDATPSVLFINKADSISAAVLDCAAASGVRLIVTMQSLANFEDSPDSLQYLSLVELEHLGETADRPIQCFTEAVKRTDLLTIIYTSGTTGVPKGVMLSHENVISNCEAASRAIAVGPDDIMLSFLPLGHSFERIAGYYLPCLFAGAQIYYSTGADRLLDDIQEVRPTIITGVPRLLEQILAKIDRRRRHRARPMRWLFSAALMVAPRIKRLESFNSRVLKVLNRGHQIWLKTLLAPVRRLLGDRLRFIVSGGASLGKEAAEFFYAAGVLVLEGYGLTEASPIVSVNRPGDYLFGTVGRPLDNVRLRLSEEGEILVKGPNVMLGYWGDSSDAGAFIDENQWLHTGDLGELDREGYLRITERKKDLFKDSAGRYISPTKLERFVKRMVSVDHVVVVGDNRPFPTALIFVRPEEDAVSISAHRRRDVQRGINRANRRLAKHERIRSFYIVTKPLDGQSELMTAALKPKRQSIEAAFSEAIEEMYAGTQFFSTGPRSEPVAREEV